MNVTPPVNKPRERQVATLVMACLGMFVAYLPVTTVSVSLPTIQAALHASSSELTWVQSAFQLPMAAFILTAGVFGDVHGRKKVYLAGLAFAAVGAAIALSAQSVEVLWVGQAFAGLGAAALLPSTLALISHAVPDPRKRATFVGLWAASLMAALAVGPMTAGVILDHTTWRWIYLPAIPVAVLTLAVAAPLVTDSRAPGERRLDWPGQITAAVAITALVYGVIEGGAASFTEGRVIAALSLAAVSAVAFVLAERRSPSPMLDLSLFRSPAFSATTLIAMITFLGLIGFFYVLSLYFGLVQRLDTLHAGYRLLVVCLTSLVVGPLAGRLMHKIPPRVMITTGLLVTTGALFSLTSLDATTGFGPLAWRLGLLGLGLGIVITPMTATAVASVPHHLAGMASAGNNAFRQVGGVLGPAILGTLLTTRSTNALSGHLRDVGLTGPAAHRITDVANADGLGAVAGMNLGKDTGRAMGALSESFLDGIHLCLIVAACLALLAALVGAVLLRTPQRTTTPTASGAAERTASDEPEPFAEVESEEVLVGAQARGRSEWPGPRVGAFSAGTGGDTFVPDDGSGAMLYGRVRDAAGTTVEGATLTLISLAGRQLGRAVAHSEGRYRMDAPSAGSYVLIAAAEGHQPQASTVVVGDEPLAHDVLLSANRRLVGTVITAGEGTPVAGATVAVTDIRGEALAADTTDASGAFAFGDLPEGDLTVVVNAAGFRPAALPVRIFGPQLAHLDVALWPGAVLRGTVRAGADRRPLDDARITLVDKAGNVIGTATTGPDGEYAFTDLDAGDYSVIASGYPPVATPVAVDGPGIEFDLELTHPER
ncbi:MFS transporter [Streptomyces coacervatus]|uniref:MFS transporter n=1 Tax=Streptomyces coacervatus TaxID=647381 RepID=A0ABP7JCZ5_9ACTN|nr:DHA2 family efflux MFS transporter permease subunit [Streptomyces coacervatus]MDF2271985.1 DHA2 family efflux MFS transporter permease subunit [Streptomyces coacervatus]